MELNQINDVSAGILHSQQDEAITDHGYEAFLYDDDEEDEMEVSILPSTQKVMVNLLASLLKAQTQHGISGEAMDAIIEAFKEASKASHELLKRHLSKLNYHETH